MEELKKCPFCGSEADVVQYGLHETIFCTNNICQCQIEGFDGVDARQQWNTRAPEMAAQIQSLQNVRNQLWIKINEQGKQLTDNAFEIQSLQQQVEKSDKNQDRMSGIIEDMRENEVADEMTIGQQGDLIATLQQQVKEQAEVYSKLEKEHNDFVSEFHPYKFRSAKLQNDLTKSNTRIAELEAQVKELQQKHAVTLSVAENLRGICSENAETMRLMLVDRDGYKAKIAELEVQVKDKDALKTIGQLITEAIKVHELKPDTISAELKLHGNTLYDLMQDKVYTNCVPVVLFKNLMLSLHIPFSKIEPAMLYTFRFLQSKETAITIKKKKPGYGLWENEESITKYTNKLKQLMQT